MWDAGFRQDGAGAAASGGPSVERPDGDDPDGRVEARAREICLRMLTAAPRTRAQLADALRRKKVPDEVAERVLGRFTDVGLIDDEAFAQAWVQSRHRGRGLGNGPWPRNCGAGAWRTRPSRRRCSPSARRRRNARPGS
ncbi:regulatory protein RecX [Actinomadura keratinilytica]|uniref:regulatory protein RecX n=1 Tax=Actinomadura keratinilytica TaxID=547461 RepID=UPI0036144DBA